MKKSEQVRLYGSLFMFIATLIMFFIFGALAGFITMISCAVSWTFGGDMVEEIAKVKMRELAEEIKNKQNIGLK